MGFFNNFFFGGGKGVSRLERKKIEKIDKAAQKPQRGGVGAVLLGRGTGPEYREYKRLVGQDLEKLRLQDKYADEKQQREWRIQDAKWEEHKDRYFGLGMRRNKISSLRDQIRRATDKGQTGQVQELDRMLGKELTRLGADERLVDRQRQVKMFERKKYLDRQKFGRKVRTEKNYEDSREQFHEGVKERREEMARQKRIQELQQMQTQSSSWTNRRLGTGKQYERFLPQQGGSTQPGSRRPPSRTVPGSKTTSAA